MNLIIVMAACFGGWFISGIMLFIFEKVINFIDNFFDSRAERRGR